MLVSCLTCSKEFSKTPSELRKHSNSFCSRSCSAAYNNTLRTKEKLPNTVCAACATPLYREPAEQIKHVGLHFCSRTCDSTYKTQQNILLWEAGTHTGIKGSVGTSKFVKKHILEQQQNKCAICQLDSIWNGKPLTLQLDHIDGNCLNNNRNNLRCLCPNCHTQTETYGSKNKQASPRYGNKKKSLDK